MADEEQLDPQLGQALHGRLLADDDPLAPAEIAEFYLPWLRRRLRELHPGAGDENVLDTAAIDALRSYLKNPGSYDPAKLPLPKFLLMAAKGDLRNAQAAARRAVSRNEEIAKNLVELGLCAPEQRIDTNRLEAAVAPFLPDPMDRQIFALMADGVQATEAYAALLGIADQPMAEQRRTVKARKDRIFVRLRRAARAGRLRLDDDHHQP